MPGTGGHGAHEAESDGDAGGDVGEDVGGDVGGEFDDFFERHHAELSRLAHLLLGGGGGAGDADDLAADALVAVWRHWDRVRAARFPLAYARGVVANMARARIRAETRERRRIALFWSGQPWRDGAADAPDVPAVLDVRAALRRLPHRKRACVVLRHAFDLSERDTARALGISVGTVKSQTSRGMAELERLLTEGGPRGRPEGGGRTRELLRALRTGPEQRGSW
ncbi:SigE family RNA polymerase sigma factor [Streptomyces sp. PT12]|uniref:SigE family RNA polymerase sigma factor n=1 Tax=Streptomyces sp. PT12 TaxID=1510197 RepID=UPI000DE480D4|nr:SigE family RNA polymerase sigma factor [Streptomyces sp. PT12]RBM17041.1 SigE family RNA polymerase sigma factor [Streptomyces sp. PT12]